MTSKIRRAFDVFYVTTKKGYDATYWVFVIIAGAGIITKLFGIAGAGASVLAFLFFYLFGKLSIKEEKRLARERLASKK